jgi:hypothetical protein
MMLPVIVKGFAVGGRRGLWRVKSGEVILVEGGGVGEGGEEFELVLQGVF